MAYLRSVFRGSSTSISGATAGSNAGNNSNDSNNSNNNNNNNNYEEEDEEMSAATGMPVRSPGVVVLSGFLKKQKSMKKKFFALKAEAPGFQACLEYYDNKKKFESNQSPKRSINISKCYNVEKRHDGRHKHQLSLVYTKTERFNIIMESEKDLDRWYDAIQLLQTGAGEDGRPNFEHIWIVDVHNKGLGAKLKMYGRYELHLTDRLLTLIWIHDDSKRDPIELPLIIIRRAGFVHQFFYIELGRSSCLGEGELWMGVEDSYISQNVYYTINNAMVHLKPRNRPDDDGPKQRMRSSSANEASKPISVLQRRNTTQKMHDFSPLGGPTPGRDRCDSLPSRARTTSESCPSSSIHHMASAAGAPAGDGQPQPPQPHQHGGSSTRLAHHVRPHSVHHHHHQRNAALSYSPPGSSLPISPASGACSTDSAASSFSMDDGSENTEEAALSKYGHSLTPDEPVILEENGDEFAAWSAGSHQKFSPNFKSCSPSQQSSYMDMYSPCGSSPGRSGYMPMSPATTGLHSRTSSLVEEGTTQTDGYVAMAPLGDDGYVDMDPSSNASHNGHFVDDMSQHGGSSCSVTSGTPSTDMRFPEFHAEKGASFLTSSDEQQARPARAYSVGSRPEQAAKQRKNKLELQQQEMSRVRAFSVGSRLKKPDSVSRFANVVTAPLVPVNTQSSKSNSAPMLSSTWSHTHNAGLPASTVLKNDHMEDLMELDFSKPSPPVNFVAPPPPPPTSYSQIKSAYSSAATTNDTSSYVDMSPGQQTVSTTASYVDMNGPNKINRNNNNSNNNINNNNISTANHNHSHSLIMAYPKPVITQVTSVLKPVEEQESPYLSMNRGSLEEWTHTGNSPKQMSSPCQDDYMPMNGPPGSVRTAPMDLPQPRQPPEGYVEMSFKPKQSTSSLEQDYTNMTLGSSLSQRRDSSGSHRSTSSRNSHSMCNNNRKKKSSMPIAIQSSSKSYKTPNYLPLSDSPTSESLNSTPASPPRATPTGSNSTIFPFSLNSPQSPIKPFSATATNASVKQPLTVITSEPKSSSSTVMDTSSGKDDDVTPVLITTTRKISAQSPVPGVDGCPSFKKAHDAPLDSPTATTAPPLLTEKRVVKTEKLGKPAPISNNPSTNPKEPLRLKTASITRAQDPTHPVSPITKKLSDLTVSKLPRLTTASPTTTSPSPTAFKPVQQSQQSQQQLSKPASPKPTSPKVVEDATPSPTPTPTTTPTPTPSPMDSDGYEKLQPGAMAVAAPNLLDSEGYEKLQPGAPVPAVPVAPASKPLDSGSYEKLQPGATLLHYASLELPEASGLPPVSPTPTQEGFNYVEIDFAKTRQ